MTSALRKLLRALSSLRLTVLLLVLSIVLIFAGTWAQIDMGIWSTMNTYFRSFFVLIPFQIFFPRDMNVPGFLPFPGGYVIGGLLTLNLVIAHVTRFKFTWKKSGIWLTHVGLFILLMGEFVSATMAKENMMAIDEGETVAFAEDVREVELAILETATPDTDQVVAIPASRLRSGNVLSHDSLPFQIRIDEFHANADLLQARPVDGPTRATRGIGAEARILVAPRDVVSGVDQNVIDTPAAYVTVLKDGRELGTWLTSLVFALAETQPEEFLVDGKAYRLTMRYKREYKPYQVHLIDFRHDRYLGTDTPKNYSSRIRLMDHASSVDREVLIYMNHPLRYEGETFYQASFKQGDTGTVLQIVRNPGWLLPYIACGIGALGLMLQFSLHLFGFLRRGRWV